jgi:hypothetical protein
VNDSPISSAFRTLVEALRRRAEGIPFAAPLAQDAEAIQTFLDDLVRAEVELRDSLPNTDDLADGVNQDTTQPVPDNGDFERFKPILLPEETTGPQFFAKITGSADADTPNQNRWVYAWTEQAKATAGYGGWSNKAAPVRSGTTTVKPARNMMEDMNNGAGVEGNGVDVANLDTATYTFAIQPIPAGVIVVMHEVVEAATGTTEYWFSSANGVDGTCD